MSGPVDDSTTDSAGVLHRNSREILLDSSLFAAILLLMLGALLLYGAIHLDSEEKSKLLLIFPVTFAGAALTLLIVRFPIAAVHLAIMGSILDQWEQVGSLPVPFLTLTKVVLIISVLALLLRRVVLQEKAPGITLPVPALAHIPFSLLCLVSTLAFAYSLKNSGRWLLAPLTLPLMAIVLTQFISSRSAALLTVKSFALYSFFPIVIAGMESVLQRRITGIENFVLYGIDDIFRVAGNFENPNDFVVLLLFSVPVLLLWGVTTRGRLARLLLFGGALLQLVILVKTYSRSGYISMAFTLFAIALLGRGKIRAFGLAVWLMGGAGLLLLPDSRDRLMTLLGFRAEEGGASQAAASIGYRKQLLYVAWQEFLKNPILGVGFGNFGARAKTYSSMLELKNTVENTYVEVLCETGLTGLAAYLYFMKKTWSCMWTGLCRMRGDMAHEPFLIALMTGYLGMAFNSFFDTNLIDNIPWVLMPVMIHLLPRGDQCHD